MVGLAAVKRAGQGTGGVEAAEKVIRVPLAKHQNTGVDISQEMGSFGEEGAQLGRPVQIAARASLPMIKIKSNKVRKPARTRRIRN